MSVEDAEHRRNGTGLVGSLPEAYPTPIPTRRSIWPIIDLAEDYVQPCEGTYVKMLKSLSMVDPESEGPLDHALIDISSQHQEWTIIRSFDQEIISNTATSQVLHTTELLENILSHLPPTNLYLARHISYTWRELIDTSPSLRDQLFITSATPEVPRKPITSPQFALNPVLTHLNLLSAQTKNKDPYVCRDQIASIAFPPRWRIKDAPWRRMQVCEPPIKRVFLRSNWLEKYVEGEGQGGVTAGQLADLLEFQTGGLFLWHSA